MNLIRLKKRFGVEKTCIVADRGMISGLTVKELESQKLNYILGARMRKVNHIKHEVLANGGRYKEVYTESQYSKAPSPLKVKEVWHEGKRYIVCLDQKQARKDKAEMFPVTNIFQFAQIYQPSLAVIKIRMFHAPLSERYPAEY